MASKRDLLVIRLAIKWKWLTPEQGEDVLFLKRKFGNKLSLEEVIRRRGYLDWEEIDQLSEAASGGVGRRARPRSTSGAPEPAPVAPSVLAAEALEPRTPSVPSDEASVDEFRDEGRTVIAAMPELLKKALARADAAERARSSVARGKPELKPLPPDDDEFEERGDPTIFEPRPPIPDTDEEEAYSDRPVLDPQYLLEQVGDSAISSLHGPESMPGEPVSDVMRGRGAPISALPQAAITVFRDEAGDEFLEGDFGSYSIKRVIARGRMSIVYLAEHKGSGTEVALKVLELPPVQAARFVTERGDELVAAARLGAPTVVKILDFGRVGEKYFVALQYVDGWTLEEMLDAGERPSYVRIAEIGRDLSYALAAAEELGILHLDLRPDHVMISESGHALLTGFGFAPDRPGLDPRGPKIRGTPEYMAPEQAQGAPDPSSDLYSLGATLYRVLTGKIPLDSIDLEHVANTTLDSPPLDPRAADPQIPEALSKIVLQLVARNREVRYQRAREVADAFEQLIFDMEAAGFQEVPEAEPPSMRPLLVRAAIGSLGLVGIALLATIALDAFELWTGPEAARSGAFFGMVGLMAASTLLSTVALIRRGNIPLPLSSAWLVGLQESCGLIGALALVAGFVLAPPAVLNVMVGSIAIVVLVSGVFGTLLRRAVANARADRGVGRMLAVLGDPLLGRWRAVHVPLIACLTLLATARFAVMAYFASA